MTRHPRSIRAGESLHTAEEMLEKLQCHHLPVRDGGRLVGVPTASDIAFAARLHPDVAYLKVKTPAPPSRSPSTSTPICAPRWP